MSNIARDGAITAAQLIAWIDHQRLTREQVAALFDMSIRHIWNLQISVAKGKDKKFPIQRTLALSIAFATELFNSGMSYAEVLQFMSNIDKYISKLIEEKE